MLFCDGIENEEQYILHCKETIFQGKNRTQSLIEKNNKAKQKLTLWLINSGIFWAGENHMFLFKTIKGGLLFVTVMLFFHVWYIVVIVFIFIPYINYYKGNYVWYAIFKFDVKWCHWNFCLKRTVILTRTFFFIILINISLVYCSKILLKIYHSPHFSNLSCL